MGEGGRGHRHDRQLTIFREEEAGDDRRVAAAVPFELNCPNGPPELREAHGFSGPELNRIAEGIAAQLGLLCLKWRLIHGTY